MLENIIEFSEKPVLHAIIVFADETKSDPLYSKKEAFAKLQSLLRDEEISEEEFAYMRDQILKKDELPWDSRETISIEIIGIGGGFPFGFLGPFGPLFGMISMLKALESAERFDVEKATFIPCSCGEKHGLICTPEWRSMPLDSEEQALEVLQEMIKKGFVTNKEKKEVEEQIKNFFGSKT